MLENRYSLAFSLYPYERNADQDRKDIHRHKVVIMGGGPIGMALALDLGLQNIPVVLLDDHEGIGKGSRAICFSKRSLEIAHRYGCAAPMVEKGVIWNLGKVFHQDRKVYEFNLLPEEGHQFPAFINLQQPYFEKFLVERIRQIQAEGAPIEIRGKNRVKTVQEFSDHVAIFVDTPDGDYEIEAEWLIGCDGASSPLRTMLNLDFEGRVFQDSFLIADIKMLNTEFPTERWFWFEPSHGSGASTLLHKQPDDIWRIDFQIGWDIDRAEELKEENIRRRLDAMLGTDIEYELVWSSIYRFQSKRMESFRKGRVIFAGDSAHQVSPFGARGANSGMQDVDNLGWKLGMVLRNQAPEALIESYNEERIFAADENILNSTRSTDFISPKTPISHIFRNAVLNLAEHFSFARPLVNSGRLSLPASYEGLATIGEDALSLGPDCTKPGRICPDAPLGQGYLFSKLGGEFVILALNYPMADFEKGGILHDGIAARIVCISTDEDPSGALEERYLGQAEQAIYLIRPDQYIAARWGEFDEKAVVQALKISCGYFA